jgi:hypothetical protein
MPDFTFDVQGLELMFGTADGVVHVVDSASSALQESETLEGVEDKWGHKSVAMPSRSKERTALFPRQFHAGTVISSGQRSVSSLESKIYECVRVSPDAIAVWRQWRAPGCQAILRRQAGGTGNGLLFKGT